MKQIDEKLLDAKGRYGLALRPVQALRGFGPALRQLRVRKKLSLQKLGKASGVGFSLIGSYEREETVPNLDTLDRVLTGMGADLWELAKELDVVNGRQSPEGDNTKALLRAFERVFDQMFELRKEVSKLSPD